MAEWNNHLKEQRKKLGLTQKEVAERAGITLRAYHRIESGGEFPRYENLKRICEVLKVKALRI